MKRAGTRGLPRPGRLPLAIVAAITCASTACHRSPQVASARMLDQTASWAASIDFTQTQQRQGLVPAALVDDVATHGVEEVRDMQHKLASADGVAPDVRDEAVVLSGRLAALLAADARRDGVDLRQVRAIETRLRALARQVRSESDARP
jgi:predicted CxxxxCH...CXXCH cytochrome family protein